MPTADSASREQPERTWRRAVAGAAASFLRPVLLTRDDAQPLADPAAGPAGETAAAAGGDQVEAELDRLAAFAGGGAFGVYTVDAEGRFLYASGAFASRLGFDPGGLVDGARRLHDVLDLAGRSGVPPFLPAPGNGAVAEAEATFVGADGRIVPARVSSRLLDGGAGSGAAARGLVRFEGVAEAASAAFDAVLPHEDLFQKAPYGIAVVDLLARITEANAAFAERAGPAAGSESGEPPDRDALLGVFMKDLVVEDDRDKFADWHGAAVRDPSAPPPVEVRFRGDLDQITVIEAVRFDGGDGRPGGFIMFARDGGEREEIDLKAVQTQKMELVGQLAGGVAHDFNNLLTAMIGFCDLLLLRHSPKDHSFADIMQIKQNANRAANLVRQLLAFSRQQTLQPKVLDLTNVLAELSHLLRRLIGASIELNMVHGRELGLVKVDQGQFEQVIINLAVNARDAMADGGTLTIRTTNVAAGDPIIAAHEDLPDLDYVVIEVSDTGCGIPPSLLDKIFEPFFTTKEVGSGTGLGLSTVYGIVKQTGGHIFVTSTEGAGATFSIFLPAYRTEDGAADAALERDDGERRRDLTGAGNVLLVEDEDAVRVFAARALRNKGYDVIEAVNAESALEILAAGEHELDLLITDVVMPGLDGPALIRSVRETHPDLKVIFISGYTEDAFRRRLDDGAQVHFLPKPFSLQQLAGKVKEVMQQGEPK